jgi:hypothetical protein
MLARVVRGGDSDLRLWGGIAVLVRVRVLMLEG